MIAMQKQSALRRTGASGRSSARLNRRRLQFCVGWALYFAVFACQAVAADPKFAESSLANPSFEEATWPYDSPRRPAVPEIKRTDRAINDVDHFILKELEAAGLDLSPEADRLALLRRVTYDLTGLPPTRQEQRDFVQDSSPNSYEKVVDRLLASSAFGERAAQHWLDLVRFAETDGFKADAIRPNAFRYRDFVIQSFNQDMPYDQFIRLQLAGDELEPGNPWAHVATGFLRLYPDESNAAELRQRRQEILNDITETTGLVFLGLTIGCAQCHDHKVDPISQADYYQFQAFFAACDPRDDRTFADPLDTQRHRVAMWAWENCAGSYLKEMEDLLLPTKSGMRGDILQRFPQEIQAMVRCPEQERTPMQRQIAAMAARQTTAMDDQAHTRLKEGDKRRYQELRNVLDELEYFRPKSLPRLMGMQDVSGGAPSTYVLDVGIWNRPKQEVSPGVPKILGGYSDASPSLASAATTGRRSALAHWLTRKDHPLTARVVVNRIWQQHFGKGIVETPNDFGAMGQPPTHPELLDYLATELVECNWSLKHIHKLIVSSATYRQSSQVRPESELHRAALKADSSNQLLWHARRRRLDGESMRDTLLQLSGELNRRAHGTSARPELPEGISTMYAWAPDANPADRNRRSIYVFARRNLRYPLFEVFDQPDLQQSCPRRAVTTTAPQALTMLNSDLPRHVARQWSTRLASEYPDEHERVRQAFADCFSRPATDEEVAASLKFIDSQAQVTPSTQSSNGQTGQGANTSDQASPRELAWEDFCHALFNSNEFLYVD